MFFLKCGSIFKSKLKLRYHKYTFFKLNKHVNHSRNLKKKQQNKILVNNSFKINTN